MGIKASASVTVAQVIDGTDGNGIKSTVVEYQAGASGTKAPTGSWSTSIPATTASAPYLWTKVTYTYTDGSAPKVVYSVGSTPEGAIESSKAYTDAQIEILDGKIISTASEVTSLGTRMSTVEQTASDLTVRINTTDSNVATAQSTADTAKANAATAQSTANTAKANAATAQSTANTARNEAANAAKTATNYLNFSSKGLIVGDVTAETLGNNVLIDSDSVDIRSGNTVLASFGSQYIYIGKESSQATVDFCNGLGTIGYKAGEISNERLYIYSNKEIEIHTEYYAVIDSSYSVTNSDGTLQELCNANININAGHGANDFHPRSIASVVERHDYINNKHYITELKMYENLISLSTDVDLGNDNDDRSELKIYYDEIWLNTGHVKLNTMIGAGETTEILGNTTFYDGIEISHNTPYIDFHFGGSTADYTSRIIENSSGTLSINGVECSDGSLTATHVTSTAEAYFNGPAYFANGQWNHLGDDVLFGDQNIAGGFCIYGVTGAPCIHFVNTGGGIASLNSQSIRLSPGGEEHGWALLGVADGMWGFYPYYNSHSLNLGTSGHKWVNVYAKNGTIQTSDEREKDILGAIDERYFAFFERIDPIKYRWRDDEKDTRVRLGIGAQTAEKALIESGLSLEEYAGISHYYFDEPLSNGLYDSYSMDYTMYTIIAAAQTKKNMYSIREIEKYQEEQKQSVKSSQQQIDQLREELSQTRTDYVELLMEVKRLKEKLESVA